LISQGKKLLAHLSSNILGYPTRLFPAFQAIEPSTVKIEKQTSFPLPSRPCVENSTPENQMVVYCNNFPFRQYYPWCMNF